MARIVSFPQSGASPRQPEAPGPFPAMSKERSSPIYGLVDMALITGAALSLAGSLHHAIQQASGLAVGWNGSGVGATLIFTCMLIRAWLAWRTARRSPVVPVAWSQWSSCLAWGGMVLALTAVLCRGAGEPEWVDATLVLALLCLGLLAATGARHAVLRPWCLGAGLGAIIAGVAMLFAPSLDAVHQGIACMVFLAAMALEIRACLTRPQGLSVVRGGVKPEK